MGLFGFGVFYYLYLNQSLNVHLVRINMYLRCYLITSSTKPCYFKQLVNESLAEVSAELKINTVFSSMRHSNLSSRKQQRTLTTLLGICKQFCKVRGGLHYNCHIKFRQVKS